MRSLVKRLVWLFLLTSVSASPCVGDDVLLTGEGPLLASEKTLESEDEVQFCYHDHQAKARLLRVDIKQGKLRGQHLVWQKAGLFLQARYGYWRLKPLRVDLDKVKYDFAQLSSKALGQAESVSLSGDVMRVRKGTYTHCRSVCPLWSFHAEHLYFHRQDKTIVLQDARLYWRGEPWLRWPYELKMPLFQQRTTGWIMPKMKINAHLGMGIGWPYFWRLDDRSDSMLLLWTFTKPQLLFEHQYRMVFADYRLDMQSLWLPFDRGTSWRGRYGFSWQLRTKPGVPLRISGQWNYVSDVDWPKDFTWITRQNQYFIPSSLGFSWRNEDTRLWVKWFYYQFLPLPEVENQYLYQLLPAIRVEHSIRGADRPGRWFIALDYLEPTGVADRTLPRGWRLFSRWQQSYDQTLLQGHVTWRPQLQLLWHRPLDLPSGLGLLPGLDVRWLKDYHWGEWRLTPEWRIEWLPALKQDDWPLYAETQTTDDSLPGSQDRLFDRNDLYVGATLAAEGWQTSVRLQNVWRKHSVCLDPDCQVDWLAQHHGSVLHIDSLAKWGKTSWLWHSAWLTGSPYLDQIRLSLDHDAKDWHVHMMARWQRKSYNVVKQSVVQGSSRLSLDFSSKLDDFWSLHFQPNVQYDGETMLGYQTGIDYRNECLQAAIHLHVAPQLWDINQHFYHRPEIVFQLNLNPTN